MIQNVMIETGWGSAPTAVVGNTDTVVVQLKLVAERVGRDIRRAWPWAVLNRKYTNAFVSGQESYYLSQDFDHSHYATFWNVDDNEELEGPLTPQAWAYNKGNVTTSIEQGFKLSIPLFNPNLPTLYIDPEPGSGEDGQEFSFWYQSANCIAPQPWGDGLNCISGVTYCHYQTRIFLATATGTTDGTSPDDDAGVTWTERKYGAAEGLTYDYPYLYDTFLADTDRSVFNEDLMERGIIAYFKKTKRFDGWEQDLVEFNRLVSQAHGGQKAAPIIQLDGRINKPWPNVPNTSEV